MEDGFCLGRVADDCSIGSAWAADNIFFRTTNPKAEPKNPKLLFLNETFANL